MDDGSNVLDVLETALDGDLSANRIRRMSDPDLNALIRRIAAYYRDVQHPSGESPEEILVCGGVRLIDGFRRPSFGDDLNVTLLYADRTALECGLGQFCEWGAWLLDYREELMQRGIDPDCGPDELTPQLPADARSLIAFYVEEYRRCAPLLRGGYLTLVAPASYAPSTELDITLLGILLGSEADGWHHKDVEPGAEPLVSSDVARGLMQARELRARFVPTIPAQADFYFDAVRNFTLSMVPDDLDTHVLSGIIGANLPLLEGLSVSDVVSIRESEDAFDIWRAELRQATRAVEGLRDLSTFRKDAQAALDDHLRIAADRVQAAVSRSQALRVRASSLALDAGFSAAAASVGAVAVGVDPAPAAVSGIGLGAAMRLAYEAIFQHSPEGDRAVISYLKQRADQQAGSTG